MLPAFAGVAQLEIRLPFSFIEESDRQRAQALLADASTLIRDEAGKTWVADGELVADLPDIIPMITIAVVKRGIMNSDGVTQETTGSYSVSLANASPDLYLTTKETQRVRRAGGRTGLWTMSTTRSIGDQNDLPGVDTRYPNDVIGEPIPWYPDPE